MNCQRLIATVETTLTIKNSKFLAIAEPITSAADAENRVAHWREIHPKANHHCYAYRLGATGKTYRANDDGEPAGTAGAPIHRQLQSFNASGTLVTVVRYFGGILLGAGGLIKAYKQAARAVLSLAEWEEILPEAQINVSCPYSAAHHVFRLAEQSGFLVVKQEMDSDCRFILQGAADLAPAICAELQKQNMTADFFPLE